MSRLATRFTILQRLLHWGMAISIVTMLFVGVRMVTTVGPAYLRLIALHKLLGVTLLAMAIIRLGVRLRYGAPPLPAAMPRWQARAAIASHWGLYLMMIAMPLLGWGMLSAGGYPIVLGHMLQLPPIAAHNATLYATLRMAHVALAYVFFAAIVLHVTAALVHLLIRRDGVFQTMASLDN